MRPHLVLVVLVALACAAGAAESTVAPDQHATQVAPKLVGTDGEWTSDLAAAREAARATGRPILIDFTGSDWCPWCIRLHDEVFATPTFKRWASAHAVLVVADFPRDSEQPPALAERNDALARHFRIRGYPTVVAVSADGTELARGGYQTGGAEAWIRSFAAKAGIAD
jgi:protein disulfide-isomerase